LATALVPPVNRTSMSPVVAHVSRIPLLRPVRFRKTLLPLLCASFQQ